MVLSGLPRFLRCSLDPGKTVWLLCILYELYFELFNLTIQLYIMLSGLSRFLRCTLDPGKLA